MKYPIFKYASFFGSSTGIGAPFFMCEEDTHEDAVVMAQLLTEEHAALLPVEWKPCGDISGVTGGTFTTHNSTQVWYSAPRDVSKWNEQYAE